MVQDDDYDAERERQQLESLALGAFIRLVGFLALMVLFGVLVLALTSCGGDAEPTPTPPDLSRYPTEKNR